MSKCIKKELTACLPEAYQFLVDEIFAVVLCELIGDIVEEIAPLRDRVVEILLDDFSRNFEVG